MRNLKRQSASLFAIAVATCLNDAVAAQERTTATYEDWVLQCEVQAGPSAQKVCDIAQVTQVQGRSAPLSRIALQRPVRGQPVKLSVQVPVNVSMRATLRIQTNDSDPGWTAPFDRCVPAGCFADFELKDDAIRKFRNSTENGKMTFKTANGQDAAIPLSFKGFGPAFDALARE